MKMYHLISGLLRVNCYILVNDLGEAVVIDGGENYKKIKQTEQEYGFKIKAVLLTHAHFDHSSSAKKLQEDGAKVYISKIDAPKLLDGGHLGGNFGRKLEPVVADYTFLDGENLSVCGFDFKVILTPGHTDGSACFILGKSLFTGDTLFLESVGRTDFPTGNKMQLIDSVKRLYALSGDYTVYPGHAEFTTLEHERRYNTFVDYD